MEQIMLRDYQKEMCLRISDAWKKHRSLMVQMPTGTGKTHLLATVVKASLDKEIWIVAHRRELVAQIKQTMERYGIAPENGPVKVMSIQWLAKNSYRTNSNPKLIVIDEAHHAPAHTYERLIHEHPYAKIMGLTATPCRMNGRGFTDLFEILITSWSVVRFMQKGYLALFDYISIRTDSKEQLLIDSLKKRGTDGDYQIKEMDGLLNRKTSIERLYASVHEFARNRKGIVYAISIAHARSIAGFYTRKGMKAAAIDSRTPAAEREGKVKAFREGEIKVLVNVDVFSEGFDCPDVEFVQLARPTLSLAKYLQQVGRGLRRTQSKKACIIIDNVGLYRVFGLPAQERDWQAMFEGRKTGKGNPATGNYTKACALPPTPLQRHTTDLELEQVVDHNNLLNAIEKEKRLRDRLQAEQEAKKEKERIIAEYRGKGKTKLLQGNLLSVTYPGKKTCYIDLLNGRKYAVKPVVRTFGNIELLRTGTTYHSRTKESYTNKYQPADYDIRWMEYYLAITDCNAPQECKRYPDADPDDTTGDACILEGDNQRVYWICKRIRDGSIVVKDREGNYYHAPKGREKVCIGNQRNEEGQTRYRRALEQITAQAEKILQQQKQEDENKKNIALNEYQKAVPVQIGSKWGLRLGERIVVPPLYRKLMPPVGKYCAVEGNPLQWGIIAVDGRMVITPRYTKVEIGKDGTARLTLMTGKTIQVKLDAEYSKKIKTTP